MEMLKIPAMILWCQILQHQPSIDSLRAGLDLIKRKKKPWKMHGGQTTLGGANVSQMPLVQNGIGDVLLCSPRWSIGLHHQLAAAQTHPKQHLMLALARWGEATAHKNTMLLGREGNLICLFSPQNPSCECAQCIQENIYKGLEEEVSEFCLSHGFPCRDRVHLRQRLLDGEKNQNSKPLTNRKFGSTEDQD